jgi:hypothetical protein
MDTVTTFVDIRGIDKAVLLKELWINSGQLRPAVGLNSRIRAVFDPVFARTIASSGYVEHFLGYMIMCDISGDWIDASKWDAMPHRSRSFREITEELRAGRRPNQTPPTETSFCV